MLVSAFAGLAAAPASHAAAVQTDYACDPECAGYTLTVTGDATGERLRVTTEPGGAECANCRAYRVVSYTGPITINSPQCDDLGDDPTKVYCAVEDDPRRRVVVNMGGGNDELFYEHVDLAGIVDGGAGNDLLSPGSPGFDAVTGGAGDDTIWADSDEGGDLYSGGGGVDTLIYAGRRYHNASPGATDPNNGVSVTPNGVADDGHGREGDNVKGDIENLTGTNGNDHLSNGAASGRLDAGPVHPSDPTQMRDIHIETLDGAGGGDHFISHGGRVPRFALYLSWGGGGGVHAYPTRGEADTFEGSATWANYSRTTGPVWVFLDGHANDGPPAGRDWGEDNVLKGIAGVVGTAAGDYIDADRADQGPVWLEGHGGDDVLMGSRSTQRFYPIRNRSFSPTNPGPLVSDVLGGGPGDDKLYAREFVTTNDAVECGPGRDYANVVRGRDVTEGCEGRSRATWLLAGSESAPQNQLGPIPVRSYALTLGLYCAIDPFASCGGKALLYAKVTPIARGAQAAGARRKALIGRAKFKVGPFTDGRLRIKLGRRGRKLLRGRRRARAVIRLRRPGAKRPYAQARLTLVKPRRKGGSK
jgi:hypothetical protein